MIGWIGLTMAGVGLVGLSILAAFGIVWKEVALSWEKSQTRYGGFT